MEGALIPRKRARDILAVSMGIFEHEVFEGLFFHAFWAPSPCLADLVLPKKCSKNPPSPDRFYMTSFVKTNALGGLLLSGTTSLTDLLMNKITNHN